MRAIATLPVRGKFWLGAESHNAYRLPTAMGVGRAETPRVEATNVRPPQLPDAPSSGLDRWKRIAASQWPSAGAKTS